MKPIHLYGNAGNFQKSIPIIVMSERNIKKNPKLFMTVCHLNEFKLRIFSAFCKVN